MTEDGIRDDIAFIRRTLEGGRDYARGRSADFLVWGIAVALGYLATYAYVRGWSPIGQPWLWILYIGLPWLYSLRRVFRGWTGGDTAPAPNPMAHAMMMLWFGCGILLVMFGFGAASLGVLKLGWFDPVVAGVLGVGFFTSAALCNLGWMRWVAFGWWASALLLFFLRGRPEQLLVAALLMLLLLAGPGVALLWRGRDRA